MSLGNLNIKLLYYYVISAIVFVILLWGVLDFTSTIGSLLLNRQDAAIKNLETLRPETGNNDASGPELNLSDAYQKKFIYDRIIDSLMRIIIPGTIFFFCQRQIKSIEEEQ